MNLLVRNKKTIFLALAVGVLLSPLMVLAGEKPELMVIKSVDKTTVSAGGHITYTLMAKNIGHGVATNVTIADNVPANATLVDKHADCRIRNEGFHKRGQIECGPVDLNSGEAYQVTFTVKADANLACNSKVFNLADVHAGNAASNWSNQVVTTIVCATPTPTPTATPTVTAVKSAPATIGQDGTITYTITVTNPSTVVAKNVRVGDTIPVQTTFVSGTPNCDLEPIPGTTRTAVWCSVGDINPGDSKTVTWVAQVKPATDCDTVIENIADITINRPEATVWSNRVLTKVLCATPTPTPTPEVDKGLRVEKTDNKDLTRPGHALTYVITVENIGDVDLHDLKVTDNIPAQVTVVKIYDGGTQSGSDITWQLNLGSGETKELKFDVKVKDNTVNNHVLHNKVTAESKDHDLKDADTDDTLVQRTPVVAAVKTITPVPVTAATGAGLIGIVSTLVGAAGLAFSARRSF